MLKSGNSHWEWKVPRYSYSSSRNECQEFGQLKVIKIKLMPIHGNKISLLKVYAEGLIVRPKNCRTNLIDAFYIIQSD